MKKKMKTFVKKKKKNVVPRVDKCKIFFKISFLFFVVSSDCLCERKERTTCKLTFFLAHRDLKERMTLLDLTLNKYAFFFFIACLMLSYEMLDYSLNRYRFRFLFYYKESSFSCIFYAHICRLWTPVALNFKYENATIFMFFLPQRSITC